MKDERITHALKHVCYHESDNKSTVLINAQNASWPRTISTITDKFLTPLATHDVTPSIKVILTMAVSTKGKAITT